MRLLSKSIVITLALLFFCSSFQLIAGDMKDLIAAGVDIKARGPLAKDLPMASYLITITNKSATPIVYDPVSIAEKTIYGSALYERFKVVWKKEILNTVLGKFGWISFNLATLYYLNQPLVIYKRARALTPQVDDYQGDSQEIKISDAFRWSDGFWLWLDYRIARSAVSDTNDIFKMYKDFKTATLLEKATTVQPSESIQFLLFLKNKNDKSLDLIYSAIQIKDESNKS